MPTSMGRCEEEINQAIASYLKNKGYSESVNSFTKEANISDVAAKFDGLLEKKWNALLRLQKKNEELERKLSGYVDKEERLTMIPYGKKASAEDRIPRPPEKLTLVGHRSAVNRVIFHPIYNLVISCSDDTSIKVWDCESGDLEKTLRGHTDAVHDLSVNSNGNLLVSCSSDLLVKLWDFTTLECLKSLKGHDHTVSSVAFLPDGEHILSASRDTSIRLWQVNTGYCLFVFRGHEEWVRMLRISPCGNFFATASADHNVLVWSIEKRSVHQTLTGHAHVVECVEWANQMVDPYLKEESTSEERLTVKRLYLASGGRDKKIKLWDATNGICLRDFLGHDNWVRDLKFHPRGKFLLSVADDKKLLIWALDEKRCRKSYEAHEHFVSSIAIHPNTLVATSSVDHSIKLWDSR
ncbi:unnamed protein product, partial [Mesorhabditis belari]|uniref:Lissencephaly-1 homolog n=1 Tax=Mesorhabditis belari TaxID=2138241 RepID=A0AAF3EJV1_9BILA